MHQRKTTRQEGSDVW